MDKKGLIRFMAIDLYRKIAKRGTSDLAKIEKIEEADWQEIPQSEAPKPTATHRRSREYQKATAWKIALLIFTGATLASFVMQIHLAYTLFGMLIYLAYRKQSYWHGVCTVAQRSVEWATTKGMDAEKLIPQQIRKFQDRKKFKLMRWDGFFVFCAAVWTMFLLAAIRDLILKGGM